MEKSLWAYYKECWTSKYADFKGRARRKEYWAFWLFQTLISIALIVGLVVVSQVGFSGYEEMPMSGVIMLILFAVFAIASIVPNLANSVRRLHDIDRTGWWILPIILFAAFVPFGFIAYIVLGCLAGNQGTNRYGEDPKNLEK